ncbi:MAG: SagB/ThcOx family dehydrogenase [Nitrososphaeria archaeon]
MFDHRVRGRRNLLKYVGAGLVAAGTLGAWFALRRFKPSSDAGTTTGGKKFFLPLPKFSSGVLVEEAMAWRRSIREYKKDPVTAESLSMLLWAAQGITEFTYGFRTVPSAGGTYPLDVYVVLAEDGVIVDDTKRLEGGSYKYDHRDHSIILLKSGDVREALADASLRQEWVRTAMVNIVVFATYERTTKVYGERGQRYVHMENGHAGQNICLMAAALGLGAVVVGAFDDNQVRAVVGAGVQEQPLYVIPVSVPRVPYKISEEDILSYYRKVRVLE